MHSENPAYNVLVDVDPEGQPDLLGNSRTAPGRITSFHFNDGIDKAKQVELKLHGVPSTDDLRALASHPNVRYIGVAPRFRFDDPTDDPVYQ